MGLSRRSVGVCALLGAGALGWWAAGPAALSAAPAGEAGPTRSPSRIVIGLADPHGDPQALARAHGLQVERALSALGAVVVSDDQERSPAALLAALRADPRVRSAGPDVTLRVAGGCCEAEPEPDEREALLAAARRWLDTGLGPIRARSLGAPEVVVAVLDTGCDARHPALAGALVPGLSAIAGAPWDEDPNGHGTAMASLVVGQGSPPGVAPAARVMPVRVADATGAARLVDVAAGIVGAVDRGAQVVLLSLGSRRPAPLLTEAVRWAAARGVLVVAAAGNASASVDLHPAAEDSVLSVGSVDDAGELAWATALAPTTDLLAPGVGAAIALPGARQGVASGTSVAAARVAGLAALLRALRPEASPALLHRLLSRGVRPLDALVGSPDTARALRAGVLDAQVLGALLDRDGPALRLADARALPARVRAGERVVVLVRVENHGLGASQPGQLVLGAGAARVDVPALGPLEERTLRAELTVAGPGPLALELGPALEARAGGPAPRTRAGGPAPRTRAGGPAPRARTTLELLPAAAPARNLALLSVRGEAGCDGELTLHAVVEGRGAGPQSGVLAAWLGERALGTQPVPPLGPGHTAALRFEVPADELPEGVEYLPARVALVGPPDDRPDDDAAALDLLVPLAAPRASTQYQQDDQLNLIADAPHRLEPGRAWLPLLVFMPEKGDLNPGTWVELTQVTVSARATPEPQPGVPDVLVYEDHHGGATTAPPSLVITDDDGRPALLNGAPDPRLFQHARLSEPGRANVLRLPRAALGLASPQTAAEDRYLEVRFQWRHRRQVLFTTTTRTGSRRWVLRVTCAVDPRPRLSGSDAYFDAHCHTVAEWYQSDGFDPLAPKRNFCGPLPMLMEAAHAVGLTDAVDAVRGRLITTDHNANFNPGDTVRDRPQVGPSSPASSRGLSEWDRYRELFGDGAGEEITLESWGSTGVGGVSLPTPGESHLLSFRGEHALGPWHGNSALAQLLQGQSFPRVRIEDVLARLSGTNRGENRRAALFPAHPFGGDWTADDFQTVFEQDPARRSDGSVHQEQTGFVAKGLQFWNSDNKRRKLDSSRIDWDDLNPWADPDWQRGRADWDDKVHEGLGRWHAEFLAPCLTYELRARPGVRFARKVFALAGNDAHGDFNFQTSRTATILRQQSSFEVSYRAFGRCVTYALADLQPAAVPAPERAFEAFLDGNALLSDGPLVVFSLDAEDRFDAGRLQWHDLRAVHEDAEGRIGGGGDFDGRGTALVRRGSAHARLRYRWLSTPEYGGDVETIEVYRTSPGDPNPVGQKPGNDPLLLPRGWLAPGAPGQDHEEPLDPAEEGLISAPTALALGAYTDPDPARMGAEERRCYTNPVWCMPWDADVAVVASEVDASGAGRIPPGGLRVRLTFDVSLLPLPYAVELKGLDAAGDSTDASVGALSSLVPVSGSGWSDQGGVRDAVFELTNAQAIPLDGPRYPAGSDRVTYVIYLRDPLIDPFGNALHRIALTFSTPGIGAPQSAWPAPAPAGGVGSTAPGATPSPAPSPAPPPSAGGGSSGGCALGSGRPGSGWSGSGPAPLALLLALGMLVRGRARARSTR